MLFYSISNIAQETDLGCILIDFENVFETTLFEGLEISDQFEEEFGLSFSLEGGGFPVITEVGGSNATAFVSPWGNDQPSPDFADFIGQYFITDDGQLSGLTSPPLLLDFATPIDSFAGCILDMDFGEVFVIEAFDDMGNLILADSIEAGDPGTGDGLPTCWGFNLDGCVGIISRVKFSGFRTQGGGFGLGLDNFSFCYSGINLDVNTVQPTCLALNGSIEIFSTSSEEYQYSLDNINFVEIGFFTDLPPAVHRVYVIDENGCETFVDVPITAAEDPLFVDVDTINTTCNLPNGSASFEVTPDLNAVFSLDGVNFSPDHVFENLAPGDYTITAIDDNQCTGELSFTIEESTYLEFSDIQTTPENCIGNDGSITVEMELGNPPYQYSLDGIEFQSSNQFVNLTPGSYTITAMDSDGCINAAEAIVDPYPFIEIIDIITTDPECLESNASIEIIASGGFGELSYVVGNSGPFVSNNVFEGLDHGNYLVLVQDEKGCNAIDSVYLEIPECPIYVPNIISINQDGNIFNSEFKIFVNTEYQVDIVDYTIFDRWGNRIFQSANFNIHEENDFANNNLLWWDGKFKNKPANEGVYSYLINGIHENGNPVQLSGTVTLVR